MTPAKSKGSGPKPPSIVILAEDENDSEVIRELLIALCPGAEGLVKRIRKPLKLSKESPGIRDQVKVFARLVAAERAVGDVICVFAHQDCDAVEPHTTRSKQIEDAFSDADCPVHAVTPAWETEAWLFLWPAALSAHRPSWAPLTGFEGRDVGRIEHAKEVLRRSLRPPRPGDGFREYRESDAPAIAKRVRDMGLADKPAGLSASYDAFRDQAKKCCGRITAPADRRGPRRPNAAV